MLVRPYIHGCNKALIKAGLVKYASAELAAAIADGVADGVEEPEMGDDVSEEDTAAIAEQLMMLDDTLQQGSDQAEDAAQIASGEEDGLRDVIASIRRKLGTDTGSTLNSADPMQNNVLANNTTGEGIMEALQRPDDYANLGLSNMGAQPLLGVGETGQQIPVGNTLEGKSAGLLNAIRKWAEGAAVETTANTNATGAASQTTAEGAADNAARPATYASNGENGVGSSTMDPPPAGAVTGVEEKKAYIANFKQVLNKYHTALPTYLTDNQKVAAIQYLVSLPPMHRTPVVSYMKHAEELPAEMKDYVEKATKKDDESEACKKDEECKAKEASSILNRMRAIQAGMR